MTDKALKLLPPSLVPTVKQSGAAPTSPDKKGKKLSPPLSTVPSTRGATSAGVMPDVSARYKNKGFLSNTGDVLRSILAGGADSATLGALPHLMVGLSQAHGTSFGMALPLAVMSMGKTILGQDNPEYEAARSALDAEKNLSPSGAFVGTLGGYLVPGAGEAKALKAAAKASPAVAKYLGSFFGRTSLASATGAGQAGIEALNRGKNPVIDTLLGGIFGGAGHMVAGELIPNLVRAARDSDAAQTGAEFLQQTMQKAKTGGYSASNMVGDATKAGPGAVLADAPSVRTALPEILGGSQAAKADPLKAEMLRRVGEAPGQAPGTDLLSNLASTVEREIPQFSHQFAKPAFLSAPTAPYLGLKTPKQMAATVKDYHSTLSPKYDALLDANKAVYASAKDVKDTFLKAFVPEGLANVPESLQAVAKAAVKSLDKAGSALTPRQVRSILTTLREKAYEMTKDADRGTAALIRGRLMGATHAIEADTLDKLPGYAALNKGYKEALDASSAHDLGYNLLKMSTEDASVVAKQVAAMPDAVYGQFLEGLTATIVKKMQPGAVSLALGKRAPSKIAEQLVNNDSLQSVLKAVLPDATNDQVMEMATAAVKQMATAKAALSPNAAKMVTKENKAASERKWNIGLITAFLSRAVSSARGVKPFQPSAAATGGAVRREIGLHELSGKATKLINDTLMASGADMPAAAKSIFDGKLLGSAETVIDKLTHPLASWRTGGAASVSGAVPRTIFDELTRERQ